MPRRGGMASNLRNNINICVRTNRIEYKGELTFELDIEGGRDLPELRKSGNKKQTNDLLKERR